MSWSGILLAVLQIIAGLLRKASDDKQFTAGQDSEIAKNALAILELTAMGKRIREKVGALPDADLDALGDALVREYQQTGQ